MRKRKRTDEDGNYDKSVKRAIAISSRMRSKYPYADYGIIRHKRGTPEGISRFGETYKLANAEQRAARKAAGYYGRGDYASFKRSLVDLGKKYIPKGTFSGLGTSLGAMLPGPFAPVASLAGGIAGNLLSNYVGFGDYAPPTTNQLVAGGAAPITVNASNDLTGDIFISHREFVGNVQVVIPASGVSQFTVVAYALNPGLAQSFPWLSQIAQNFTLYEFQGLMYEYKPTSGEGAGNTNALGKVIMATNYDPNATTFQTSSQMESYDYAQSVKPSCPAVHGVETHPGQQFGNMQYVRTGQTTRDKVFTDIGSFQIATEGVVGAANSTLNVGELWVTYRVKLSRASLFGSLLAYNQSVDQFWGAASATNIFGSTISSVPSLVEAAKYPVPVLANTMARRSGSNIGCTIVGTGDATFLISFPSNIVDGVYEITITGGSVAGTSINQINLTNCVDARVVGSALQNISCAADTNSLFYSRSIYVRVTAPGTTIATVAIGLNGIPPSGAVTQIKITVVNQSLL